MDTHGLATVQEDRVFGVSPAMCLANLRAVGPAEAQTFCLLATSGISVVYVGNMGGQ